MFLIHKKLAETSARYSNKTALLSDNVAVTYSDLINHIDILSDILILEGLRKDSKVVLLLNNRATEMTAIFAAMRSGGIAIPIDATSSVENVQNIVRHAKPWMVITTNEDLERFPVIRDIVSCQILFMETVLKSPLQAEKSNNNSLSYLDSRSIDKLMDIQSEDIALSVPYSFSAGNAEFLNFTHTEILNIIKEFYSPDNNERDPSEADVFDKYLQFGFIKAIHVLLNGGTANFSLSPAQAKR
jgi:acyl-coenzyme A synthetase/AMP-(fatty) acid ligase